MAGSLTLGGLAAGLLAGQVTFGPSTVTGTEAISEIVNVTLVANTDSTVEVPTGAKQWAAIFSFQGETPTEVKVRTNLNSSDTGMPIGAQGFVSAPVFTGVTALKFKAATPPAMFQVFFV